MNSRAMTLALMASFFAVFMIYTTVDEMEMKTKNRFGQMVQVLRASKDINEAESLETGFFVVDSIPKTFLEPSAISFIGDARAVDENFLREKALLGAVAIVPIRKGEQITLNKISEPGVKTGLAPQVAPGKRAVAIDVSDQSAVAKLLKPGDRVDVIAVIDPGQNKAAKMARTFLQDVLILSVGKYVTNNLARTIERDGRTERVKSLSDNTDFRTITIELDPVQAQSLILILSGNENKISLTLRNNADSDRSQVSPITVGEVLNSGPRGVRSPASTEGATP